MRKKVIPLALILIFLLILAWPGKAQRGRFWGLWADQSLNLTEDQLAKIQDLRLEFQKAILPLRMEVQKHYLELRRMIRSNVSQAEIQAKMNQIDKLESELKEKFITHQKQIRDLLTPEQKV
ncbi:MAG TPA: periplasmic heavy metal sensor, partial [Candidatus Aminicenantes bacterium]|nr:periplasmic heavy metal sensor [Candidatus Aminicenantes bacterium]